LRLFLQRLTHAHACAHCHARNQVEYPDVTSFAPDDSEDEDAADGAFTIGAFSMYTTH
jgi:hypothetical protein